MRNIVCIFAHPDDEAFGPSGTIAKFTKKDRVYIICVTDGGTYGDKKLAQIRKLELENSGKILGVKKIYFLGFKDGTLSNNLYHEVAKKIEVVLKKLKPETLITFEPRGVSGHLDHISVTMITNFLFDKLPFIKKVLFYCIDTKYRKFIKHYFIYFPSGYEKNEIDLVVDITYVYRQKIESIKAHVSQRGDGEAIQKMLSKLPKAEYFLVSKKTSQSNLLRS